MAKKKAHRGRIQAQGNDLEASESWHQKEPLSKEEGLDLLNRLRNKLSSQDRNIRKKQFKDAERFIRGVEGGIDAPLKKTFQNYKTKGNVRVDIEVWSGSAFLTIIILILIGLWLLF